MGRVQPALPPGPAKPHPSCQMDTVIWAHLTIAHCPVNTSPASPGRCVHTTSHTAKLSPTCLSFIAPTHLFFYFPFVGFFHFLTHLQMVRPLLGQWCLNQYHWTLETQAVMDSTFFLLPHLSNPATNKIPPPPPPHTHTHPPSFLSWSSQANAISRCVSPCRQSLLINDVLHGQISLISVGPMAACTPATVKNSPDLQHAKHPSTARAVWS